MTAFQELQRGRYIGPVWIGIHGVLREQRIIIDANGVQHLTMDQARRLGAAALALADELSENTLSLEIRPTGTSAIKEPGPRGSADEWNKTGSRVARRTTPPRRKSEWTQHH
jgi:hypothetical protein